MKVAEMDAWMERFVVHVHLAIGRICVPKNLAQEAKERFPKIAI